MTGRTEVCYVLLRPSLNKPLLLILLLRVSIFSVKPERTHAGHDFASGSHFTASHDFIIGCVKCHDTHPAPSLRPKVPAPRRKLRGTGTPDQFTFPSNFVWLNTVPYLSLPEACDRPVPNAVRT